MMSSPGKKPEKPEPVFLKKSVPAEERNKIRSREKAMEEYLTVYNLSATENRIQ
jgi:hypothetical protein